MFVTTMLSVKRSGSGAILWDGSEVGHFDITAHGDVLVMAIGIDEKWRGRGCSKWLMRQVLKDTTLADTQLLYIDVDFSNGFWRHVGMTENRYGLDYKGRRAIIGRGYEKCITVARLKAFAYKP